MKTISTVKFYNTIYIKQLLKLHEQICVTITVTSIAIVTAIVTPTNEKPSSAQSSCICTLEGQEEQGTHAHPLLPTGTAGCFHGNIQPCSVAHIVTQKLHKTEIPIHFLSTENNLDVLY